MGSTLGIEFKARIDEPIIELRRCIAPAGTSIKIWVSDPKIIDKLRPYSNQFRSYRDNGTEILLDSWSEVDWFAQAEPRVEYSWNGFNRSMKANVQDDSCFRISATFSPKDNKLIPQQGTSTSTWERLLNPEPYKDIYWIYKSKESQDGVPNWKNHHSDEVTVNGIRVEEFNNAYHRYTKLHLPDNYFNNGPVYSIARPSMAIFDPAGICPINLQRSAISFDRMGMDSVMIKAILSVHLRDIVKNARSSGTVAGFHKLCVELAKYRDIRYEGIHSVICATFNGVFLAAPNVLTQLEIKTLYFVNVVNAISSDSTRLSNILNDDEALVFRLTSSGIQNDLEWFRGVLCGDAANDYGYARSAGFPRVSSIASILVMPPGKWKVANEKGRINRSILNVLTSKQLESGDFVATNGNDSMTKQMLSRCQSISKVMGENLEIGGWSLSSDQIHGYESSLIVDMWLGVNNDSLIASFD